MHERSTMTTRMTEEVFLNRRIGRSVAIYLINGIKLVGTLRDHDTDVVFLASRDEVDIQTQMISKAAISTIVSASETPTNLPSSDPLDGILNRRD